MSFLYATHDVGESVACADVSSGLTILHLLGRLESVADSCDPAALGRGLASLQAEDGLLRPSLDENVRDRFPGDTALHALVAIQLLDRHFGIDSLDDLRAEELAQSLSSLVDEALSSDLDPYGLHTIYSLVASLYLLNERVQLNPRLIERTSDAMLGAVGLLALWNEYKREHPGDLDSFFSGLGFVSSLAKSDGSRLMNLASAFPAGKTREAGCFSTFPTIAGLSVLGMAGGVGLLLGMLGPEVWAHNRTELTWRFNWNSVTLPFVLRHYPLLETAEVPLLWCRGAPSVQVALTSASAAAVSRLSCGVGPAFKRRRTFAFPTRAGRAALKLTLRSLTAPRVLLPGGTGTLELGLQLRSGYPRYPLLQLPDLAVRCRYRGRDWELPFHEPTIQVLPRKSRVARIVSEEGAKARYDPAWTVRSIKRRLRQSGFQLAMEPIAQRLYRGYLPSLVEDWIRQFEPDVRPGILKLYRALRYYSIEDTRDRLARALRLVPRQTLRTAAFVGMGKHLAKSGTHLLYFVKHIYRELFPQVHSKEVTQRFQPLSLIARAESNGQLHVSGVVMIDDFFGSGQTAVADLSRLASETSFSRLWQLPRYYVAVTGFSRGMREVVRAFPEMRGRVLTGAAVLVDQNRAFHWPGGIFTDPQELRHTRRVCAAIGEALLARQVTSARERRKRALGWDGDEALIAFEHNTPNNTLPIFWARGSYKGAEWQPLYRRRE